MKHALANHIDPEEILEFFTDVFTASANAEEGELVGGIARQLAQQVDDQDVLCFTSTDEGDLVAAIFFSRLTYPEHLNVLLMSPVAVSSAYQGKGLGQAIITYALNELQRRGVDIAITYGDPAFYCKTGFLTITEDATSTN